MQATNWKKYKTDDGKVYYYNKEVGRSEFLGHAPFNRSSICCEISSILAS